jgi:hypothetical protein
MEGRDVETQELAIAPTAYLRDTYCKVIPREFGLSNRICNIKRTDYERITTEEIKIRRQQHIPAISSLA